MKLTLLDIVQRTLSSMDSEAVNSISDTEESLMVADVCEDVYYTLLESKVTGWEFLKRLRELEPLADGDYPNYLKIPNVVSEVYHVSYNVRTDDDDNETYRELVYKQPKDFLRMVGFQQADDTTKTTVVNQGSVPMYIRNDIHPTYWTSFDDKHIVTDSWNSEEDSTLQASKSLLYCLETPPFYREDEFVPDLPDKMFPLYLANVKTDAFYYLKQEGSETDIRKGRRLLSIMLNSEGRVNDRSYRGFGRK